MAKKKDTTWGPDEVGVYADSARGFQGQLSVVIDTAVSEGMAEPSEDDIEEFPDEVWDEAEEWLNDNVAREGFYFGSPEGEWGYFPVEEE